MVPPRPLKTLAAMWQVWDSVQEGVGDTIHIDYDGEYLSGSRSVEFITPLLPTSVTKGRKRARDNHSRDRFYFGVRFRCPCAHLYLYLYLHERVTKRVITAFCVLTHTHLTPYSLLPSSLYPPSFPGLWLTMTPELSAD